MKVTFLKSLFVAVVVLSLSFLIGCAGFEYAPKKNYLIYHKELPQAERAVDDAAVAGKNKQCPDEFNEAKTLMEKAYETYWACRTQEAIAMAKEARAKALALCPPPPTCELTAAPKEIELEQSSTLTMKTAGKVKTALLDGTTVSTTGGTKNVTPPNTMPYLAHVAGPGGSGTCSATVTVTPPPAPTCELTANPKEIAQGQTATLTLKTGGKVKSAVLDGTEVAAAGGTKSVSPKNTSLYMAQCSGPGGSAMCSTTVSVTPPTTITTTPTTTTPVMDRMIIHINFNFDKSEIRDIDKAEMQRAINFVRKYSVTQITVEGHTDAIGTDKYNQSLSERRAEAVKKYLVKEGGIDETKISTIGYGESKPVTSNDTAEGRAANRRAEILVLSK